jgi:hypothetical protein
MSLNIRNEAVNPLAAKLAARTHTNKTDALRIALENELRRRDEVIRYWGVPKVRAWFEATYFAGLRKAGMPEESTQAGLPLAAV